MSECSIKKTIKIGNWQEEKYNERQKAIELSEKAKDLPHLKNKPIKYLLK